jgi:hypothetical protein
MENMDNIPEQFEALERQTEHSMGRRDNFREGLTMECIPLASIQGTPMSKIFGFVCAVVLLAAMVPDAFAQLHLNVPLDQHVVLMASRGPEPPCVGFELAFNQRVLPSGEIESFSIPKDKTLVITDVHWRWVDFQNRDPNQNFALAVSIRSCCKTVLEVN